MSTASTSSTSTSTEPAALLPGRSAKRHAAKALQAASASVAAPAAPNSHLRRRIAILDIMRMMVTWASRQGKLSPQGAVRENAHEPRQAQPGAHETAPVVPLDLAA